MIKKTTLTSLAILFSINIFGQIQQNEKKISPVKDKIQLSDTAPFIFSQNFVDIDIFNLIINRKVTLSYVHIFSNGFTGFRIPISFGFNNDSFIQQLKIKDVFSSGVEFNYYPQWQGQAFFISSLALNAGRAKYLNEKFANVSNKLVKVSETLAEGQFYSAIIKIGLVIELNKHFKLMILPGFGLRHESQTSTIAQQGYRPIIPMDINIGYKF